MNHLSNCLQAKHHNWDTLMTLQLVYILASSIHDNLMLGSLLGFFVAAGLTLTVQIGEVVAFLTVEVAMSIIVGPFPEVVAKAPFQFIVKV